MTEEQDYPWIRKWGVYLVSSPEYIEAQVQLARSESAPQDSIYRNHEGVWQTIHDITSMVTRHHLGLD